MTILGQAGDPRLPAHSVDAVLLLKTYHEVAEPVALLKNLRIALHAGAKVGIIDRNAKLTDEEAMQLILEPGFSTAGRVTQAAGRGVGMDVVATEVKRLGGGLFIAILAIAPLLPSGIDPPTIDQLTIREITKDLLAMTVTPHVRELRAKALTYGRVVSGWSTSSSGLPHRYSPCASPGTTKAGSRGEYAARKPAAWSQ